MAVSLGFTNPGGTGGKWDMCLCFGCGCVGGVGCLGPGRVGWECALGQGGWGGIKSVFVVSLDSLC